MQPSLRFLYLYGEGGAIMHAQRAFAGIAKRSRNKKHAVK
jgi:hypothetical protein